MPQAETPLYKNPLAPYLFDLMAPMVFGPRSLPSMRDEVVRSLALEAGTRVLELGCGSGAVTRRLVATGAAVTAVDRSDPMLRRARRRAPEATFHVADATAFEIDASFDRVLCMFFLHELDSEERTEVFRRVSRLLSPEGFALAVEVAAGGAGSRPAWRRFIDSFEPPTVREVMEGSLTGEAEAAGLHVGPVNHLLSGRVQVIRLAHAR